MYQDATVGFRATVKRFKNGRWRTVGQKGITSSRPNPAAKYNYTCLSLAPDGTPYIVYSDSLHNNKTTVLKFKGSQWETVGFPDFSDSGAAYLSLSVSNAGIPYVAYVDAAKENKISVQKFKNNHWVFVGSQGFSDDSVQNLQMVLNQEGQPYVIFDDLGKNKKAGVLKFDGNHWVTVGHAVISNRWAHHPGIVINNKGVPYIVYKTYDSATAPIFVKKFVGNHWVAVGQDLPDSSKGAFPYLAINPLGIPYVLYYVSEPVSAYWGIVVKQLGFTNSISRISDRQPNIKVYPNPNSGTFSIQGHIRKAIKKIPITITNITGKVVYKKIIKPQNKTIEARIKIKPYIPDGAYVVSLNTGQQSRTFKVLVLH